MFVPIRYRIKGNRKASDEVPIRVQCAATWLLHFVTVRFRYPEEAYIKVRVLGIPIYSSADKKEEKEQEEKETTQKENKENAANKDSDSSKEETVEKKQEKENKKEVREENAAFEEQKLKEQEQKTQEPETEELETKEPTILKFFKKLWQILKNIKYTIRKIYDKIKEIIKNIKYYIAILQSDTFQRAYELCKGELQYLLKDILPGKLIGNFTIGTGDPASTAKVLAVHGMLYPIVGNHINITPDFENTIIEGDFFIKGKITVFKVLKTAIKVYFNKDIRRVIQLLKKGGSTNGRK